MNLSQRIAAVLGPTLVALTVSEAINLHIWDGVQPTVVYLNGLVFLISGLVITTSHNRWQVNRGLLVTLSGWMLVLVGAARMFFPEAPQPAPGPAIYTIIALLGVLGVSLSLFAFRKRQG